MTTTRSVCGVLVSLALILLLLGPPSEPVRAANICVWTGTVSNAWDNAGNWSLCSGVAPQLADTVSITGSANPDPVLDGNATITRLDNNPTGVLVVVGGATLTVNAANLTGRFSGPGTLAVQGAFRWGGVESQEYLNDGILEGNGTLRIEATGHGYINGSPDHCSTASEIS